MGPYANYPLSTCCPPMHKPAVCVSVGAAIWACIMWPQFWSVANFPFHSTSCTSSSSFRWLLVLCIDPRAGTNSPTCSCVVWFIHGNGRTMGADDDALPWSSRRARSHAWRCVSLFFVDPSVLLLLRRRPPSRRPAGGHESQIRESTSASHARADRVIAVYECVWVCECV